jgi:hypothetical protein
MQTLYVRRAPQTSDPTPSTRRADQVSRMTVLCRAREPPRGDLRHRDVSLGQRRRHQTRYGIFSGIA